MEIHREFVPSFRKIGDLTIYFQTSQKVYVWDEQAFIAIYRASDKKNGYYEKQWKPMLEKLYRSNYLASTFDVARVAQRFDIDLFCPPGKPPEIPPCTMERPSKFKQGMAMGIFKPTDTSGYHIVIYSKWCLTCESPDEFLTVSQWALENNLDLIFIRTTYKPADHKRAAEIYGSPDYPTFVVYDDVKTLKDFVKMIRNTKNKMVKDGKTKGGKGDMQGLSKTEDTKRKDSGAGAVSKDENKTKE